MHVHELKTWPEPFRALWDGRKTAEFRRDDRGYTDGDRLVLMEFDPDAGRYSGRLILATVTDVRRGGDFGVPEGYAMLSLRKDYWEAPAPQGE